MPSKKSTPSQPCREQFKESQKAQIRVMLDEQWNCIRQMREEMRMLEPFKDHPELGERIRTGHAKLERIEKTWEAIRSLVG